MPVPPRKTARLSVLDELVYVGRSGPVLWHDESAPDEEADDGPLFAFVALTEPGTEVGEMSTRETVGRVAALIVAAVSIIMAIALALGYAA